MRHVGKTGVDDLGDLVVSLLQEDVDVLPRLLDVVPDLDEVIEDRDRGRGRDHGDDDAENEQDRFQHATSLRAGVLPASIRRIDPILILASESGTLPVSLLG